MNPRLKSNKPIDYTIPKHTHKLILPLDKTENFDYAYKFYAKLL